MAALLVQICADLDAFVSSADSQLAGSSSQHPHPPLQSTSSTAVDAVALAQQLDAFLRRLECPLVVARDSVDSQPLLQPPLLTGALEYLLGELQAARMTAAATHSTAVAVNASSNLTDAAMEVVESASAALSAAASHSLVANLNKIASVMDVPAFGSTGAPAALSASASSASSSVATSSAPVSAASVLVSTLSKINVFLPALPAHYIEAPLIARADLTEAQCARLASVNDKLFRYRLSGAAQK